MTVYFVKSTALQLIKIGYTTDLHSRLVTLSNEFLELTLLGYQDGDYQLEQTLHAKFSDARDNNGFLGREWFRDTRKIRYYISRNCTKPSSDIEVWGSKPEPGIKLHFRRLYFENRVRHKRAIGITEIAKKTGIHIATLRRYGYELPMRSVSSEHIEKLCVYFDCELSELLCIEGIDDVD